MGEQGQEWGGLLGEGGKGVYKSLLQGCQLKKALVQKDILNLQRYELRLVQVRHWTQVGLPNRLKMQTELLHS